MIRTPAPPSPQGGEALQEQDQVKGWAARKTGGTALYLKMIMKPRTWR